MRQRAVPPQPSGITASDRPPRVLVVDDDPHIRKLIIASLKRERYDFLEASNGRPALEAMRRGEVDVVILDLMMPEVSGWDVLEARVRDEKMKKIPVVVISANRDPEVARAFAQGIAAFLPKPFDINALNALVRSCIEQAAVAATETEQPN
jgi:CheY-like chemotaxis protein